MPINKFTTLLDLARQAKIISGETATFDGKIEVGIPFSGYPTGVDTGTTVSLGVVSSETAVFSGNTGTTVFDVSNTGSTNYDAIFSGYSSTIWSNSLFSGNTSGLTLPITPLSASTQIVGPFWTLTQTGMTGDYVIGTQYTGYSVTYSFLQVSELVTGFTYTGFTTATQENFSAGTLDYKGPLDYISSVEDATIDGRLTTNKLTVTGGASAGSLGYVLTQTGDTGEVGWVFNSSSGTTTYWDEGSGLFDKLGNHTMSSGSNTDFSIIAGGESNEISAGFPIGKWNAILGGSGNTISASNFGVIKNGIIGGEGNEIGGTGAGNENCVIIGGQNNSFVGSAEDSVIIGMSGKTVGTGANKVYTPDLDIEGTIKIVDGTEQNGYVLTCDATGLGSWEPKSLTNRRVRFVDAQIDPNTNDLGGSDIIFYSGGTGGGTITLGTGNDAGNEIILIRFGDTVAATLAAAGSNINGSSTKPLPTALYSTVRCIFDGTEWYCTNETLL